MASLKWICLLALPATLLAQEAGAGFDLQATLTAQSMYSQQLSESPRDGSPLDAGFRALLYPTWKFNQHWSISSTVQVNSRPYTQEDFETRGRGVRGDLLRAHVTYSLQGRDRSLVVRVGMLPTVFGSFLLRYDDTLNPLLGAPQTYGYYDAGITLRGLAGAQVDATLGRFDMRAQYTNSSPANRRSVFDHDQYGSWAGGAGYTIRQGLRIGASAFRGPYLNRDNPEFLPNEAAPRTLPATAFGIDAEWGHGPWNVRGEQQWFNKAYQAIPTETHRAGYVEARRVLNPRWYAATRIGYMRSSEDPGYQTYETAVGFRLNTTQLLKFGYTVQQGEEFPGTSHNTFAIQFVTHFRALSLARD